MRTFPGVAVPAAIGLLLGGCASELPPPEASSAVSIMSISPASSTLRQADVGLFHRITAGGNAHRGVARISIADVGQTDVQFVFPDFKSLNHFTVSSEQGRFQCDSRQSETGLDFGCSLNGRTVNDRITASADSVRVLVPAGLFVGGQPVQLQWLE